MSLRFTSQPSNDLQRTQVRAATMPNSASLSLLCLFQVLTACCVFFACLRISPSLTLFGTILISPAIIRTAWASDLYRRRRKKFCWKTRLSFFLGSLGVVVTTISLGGLVFSLICLVFALLGLLFGLMVSTDLILEAAVVGTAGGMIWGMAGALLAVAFTATRIWTPQVK